MPTAPEILPTLIVVARAGGRARCRDRSRRATAPASDRSVVGSACTPCVRPIIGVRRCSNARSRTAVVQPVEGPSRMRSQRLAHLQRLRRVDDVGGRHARNAASAPTARRARRRPSVNAITSCWVRCSISSMRAMSNAPRSRMSRAASGGIDARRRHGFGGGRFDQQPGLVPALVAPDSPHFRVRIAWNHS
mgnify:CR=1 FL=1